MTSFHTGRVLAAASAAVLALGLAACGSSDQPGGAAADGKLGVAVSTNVWGSVVSAVGGDQVDVKTLIDADGDPHSYQASAEDAADVQGAGLLVYNGGGYDDFFGQLAEQAPDARKVVAFDVSGKGSAQPETPAQPEAEPEPAGEHGEEHAGEEHAGEEHGHEHGAVNEHVWYDLPSVAKVADQLAVQLGELRPDAKQAFTDNAAAFKTKIDELVTKTAKIGADRPDSKVIATEPVAHYLLDTAKITDATPHDFTAAIEQEGDVPVAAQDEVNQLIAGKQVRAVLNNPQTSSPVTEQLVAGAKAAGLPVVDVTETLPAGQNDYIAWMTKEVDALAGALTGP